MDILQLAKGRRDKLMAEVRKLNTLIEGMEELALSAQLDEVVEELSAVRKTKRPAPVMDATYNAASKVLSERGYPVPLGKLLTAITGMGVDVGGRNRAATLSARLSNSDRFKSHRGIGWWFADRPLPGEVQSTIFDSETAGTPSKDAPAVLEN